MVGSRSMVPLRWNFRPRTLVNTSMVVLGAIKPCSSIQPEWRSKLPAPAAQRWPVIALVAKLPGCYRQTLHGLRKFFHVAYRVEVRESSGNHDRRVCAVHRHRMQRTAPSPDGATAICHRMLRRNRLGLPHRYARRAARACSTTSTQQPYRHRPR